MHARQEDQDAFATTSQHAYLHLTAAYAAVNSTLDLRLGATGHQFEQHLRQSFGQFGPGAPWPARLGPDFTTWLVLGSSELMRPCSAAA